MRGAHPLEDCCDVVAAGRYERRAICELLGDVWSKDAVEEALAHWLDMGGHDGH